MVMVILTSDDYLYEKKRDILVLQLKSPKNEFFFYHDGLDDQTEKLANEQLEWFTEHGIDYKHTCSPDTIVGWEGLYYIDLDPNDSTIVEQYTKKFEDENGKSLYPDYYQMLALSYDEWVINGGLKRHEQLLKDRQDPNYNI